MIKHYIHIHSVGKKIIADENDRSFSIETSAYGWEDDFVSYLHARLIACERIGLTVKFNCSCKAFERIARQAYAHIC